MRIFTGLPVASGYGSGRVYLYRGVADLVAAAASTPASDPSTEHERFEAAAGAARRELQALSRRFERDYGAAEAGILHAQFFMLDDPSLRDAVLKRVEQGGIAAEGAVAAVIEDLEQRFRASGDAYMRERALDIHDVGVRLLRHLADRTHHPLARLPDRAVLVAELLFPSDTLFLDRAKVRGIVTERGSENSHAAILSRALGVPAVTNVPGVLAACRNGDRIAIDGETGRVILGIEGGMRDDYKRRARTYHVASDVARADPDADTATLDGMHVTLMANIASPDEAALARQVGAAGIGLFRTEFLYTAHGGVASEEEQLSSYRAVFAVMGPRPVTIRTFDVAPDKVLAVGDDVPFARSGIRERGINFSLRHPELLRPQLRAILRASRATGGRVLLPGVTDIAEIDAVRRHIESIRREPGMPRGGPDRPLLVGAMIETLPALLMVDEIVRLADFVCVGTNDLLAHLFGRERQCNVSEESVFEPSLLRSIDRVIAAGRDLGKEVSLCGEMAGTSALTALLLGLGLRVLSMSPERLPEVRYNIRQLHGGEAARLAGEVRQLGSAEEIRERVFAETSPWKKLLDRGADDA